MPNNTPDTLTPEWLEKVGFFRSGGHSGMSSFLLVLENTKAINESHFETAIEIIMDGPGQFAIYLFQDFDLSDPGDDKDIIYLNPVLTDPPTKQNVVRLLAALGVGIEGEGT